MSEQARGGTATAIGARLVGLCLALALRSVRWRVVTPSDGVGILRDQGSIIGFWHETLPLMPAALRAMRRRHGWPVPVHVLVSRHRDGALATAVLEGMGAIVIRGSSGRIKHGRTTERGGASAFRQMLDLLAQAGHVGITPDGPRGPARRAHAGAGLLAATSGVRFVPCAAATRPSLRLPSWDGMRLPVPFTRGTIVIGEPITVGREDRAQAVREIEGALDEALRRAEDDAAASGARTVGGLDAWAWCLATTLAAPVLAFLLIRRRARGKEIAGRLAERRGIEHQPRPAGTLIWVHAASVGESLAVLPVIDALVTGEAPAFVLLTTGTANSARLIGPMLSVGARQGRSTHRMVPLDVPRWLARFLDHWRPDAAVLIESELWPNLIGACADRRVPLALLNARLSGRSAAGWRRAPSLARRMLGSFDAIVARSAEDAQRLVRLGAEVRDIGDLKRAGAELPCDAAELGRLRRIIGQRPCLIAASTHPGEEDIVATACRALAARHPGLLAIVAPRHPERGPAVAALLDAAPRRGAGEDPSDAATFWVADTLGELGLIYRLGGIAFLGRSLLAGADGGQNPLEPARLGLAIAIGPLHGNFLDAVSVLHDAGALAVVRDADAVCAWADALLACPDRAREAGARGRDAIETERPDLPAELARLVRDLAGRGSGTRQAA